MESKNDIYCIQSNLFIPIRFHLLDSTQLLAALLKLGGFPKSLHYMSVCMFIHY